MTSNLKELYFLENSKREISLFIVFRISHYRFTFGKTLLNRFRANTVFPGVELVLKRK